MTRGACLSASGAPTEASSGAEGAEAAAEAPVAPSEEGRHEAAHEGGRDADTPSHAEAIANARTARHARDLALVLPLALQEGVRALEETALGGLDQGELVEAGRGQTASRAT